MENSRDDKSSTWLGRRWEWICKNWWYLVLLIGSTGFVYFYRLEILALTGINAVAIGAILWVILLLLPLFSEFEFLGIKLKKEIEKANVQIKEAISDIKLQILEVKSVSSATASITQIIPPLANNEQLDQMMKILESIKANTKIPKITAPIPYTDNDPSVELFKMRFNIENLLFELCNKSGFDGYRNVSKMLNYAIHLELIDSNIFELALQVSRIASRGIHGELINDKYMDFAREAYPKIIDYLKMQLANLPQVICSRCGYSGYSYNADVCPRCNRHTND